MTLLYNMFIVWAERSDRASPVWPHVGMCALVPSKFLPLCACVQMTVKGPNIHFGLQISYSKFAIIKSTNNEDQLYVVKISMLGHPAKKTFSNWLRSY